MHRDRRRAGAVPSAGSYFLLRAGLSCSATSSSAPAEPILLGTLHRLAGPGSPDRDRGLADRFADDHLLVPLYACAAPASARYRRCAPRGPSATTSRATPSAASSSPAPRPDHRSRPGHARWLVSRRPARSRRPTRPPLIAAVGQERRQDGHADAADHGGRRLEFAAHPGDLEPTVEVVLADRPDHRTEQRDVLRGLHERGALGDIIDSPRPRPRHRGWTPAPRRRLRRPHASGRPHLRG